MQHPRGLNPMGDARDQSVLASGVFVASAFWISVTRSIGCRTFIASSGTCVPMRLVRNDELRQLRRFECHSGSHSSGAPSAISDSARSGMAIDLRVFEHGRYEGFHLEKRFLLTE